MKYDQVLVRFGDLMLKGKNRNIFIDRTVNLIRQNIKDLNVKMRKTHDRVYITINDVCLDLITNRLKRVSGLGSFSFVKVAENDLDKIVEAAVFMLNNTLEEDSTFKIETKRANKRFPLTSLETSQEVAKKVLPQLTKNFKVDVRNPKQTLHIEIRDEETYLFMDSIKGLGGFPVGVGGKGISLLSGGIDSPVATFLAMKQGVLAEGIHFDSSPLTPVESAQKVIDLSKKLALYTPNHEFVIHMVPFHNIHMEILKKVPDPYLITVMRRIMFRIAEELAKKLGILALITGESIGQVASQTIESFHTIENVTNIPILRPVLTYDKQEIVNIAHELDLYNISIRPFEDCCAIYLPKNPTTKPTIRRAEEYEANLDIDKLVSDAVEHTYKWDIKADSDLDITNYGFTTLEAWEAIKDDSISSKWESKRVI